ncbi:MAG: redoxin domain-containing protein [Ruminococcaceae bacterium]|nr:redoxin domain-containing protein [Oscillospiraceae bacterium]
MKTFKRTVTLLLALCMITALMVGIVGCDNGNTPDSNITPAPSEGPGSSENGTYNISVKSFAGMVLSDIDVYVYADNSLTDLKTLGKTDANGYVSFDLPKNDNYAIELRGLPKGYNVEPYYSFTGNTALITLSTSVVKEELPGNTLLKAGDVMYDFTFTTPGGEKINLAEILKEKDAVLLNFWYVNCPACVLEFPYMQEAYEMYGDDIEIVAVSPMDADHDITKFQNDNKLTFKMASCSFSWPTAFSVTGYPTSVLIDKYGMICLVEVGALTSLRPFTSMFDHFTADDYKQKICTSIDDLITKIKPNKEMDTSENIGNAINSGSINVTYRPETESSNAEYAWPFIIDEKYGRKCIYASNKGIEDSYAAIYADIELKKGQAIGFDYIISSEAYSDIMFVIVQKDDIYSISGLKEAEGWKSCYPWVALEDGTYELALVFSKDSDTNEGDDTVYISNMRVIDAKNIDSDAYISRNAATEKDGTFEYADIVFNSNDGYYHVGSENGPLLLVDLMNLTLFNEEKSIFDLTYEDDATINGVKIYEAMINYFSYASNSSLNGVCTVNGELAEFLKEVANIYGFDNNEKEWLKACRYYQYYGPIEGKQLVDPIQGLATFSATTVVEGKDNPDNYFYYDRVIIPRGVLKKFVPTKTGVYRITSKSTSIQGVNGWIFNEQGEIIYTYEHFERLYEDTLNVSMVYFMEAGKSYYIDIAFWDVYEVGSIYFDIEYIGRTFDLFQVCSPGYYTYDTDATGEAMYETISGGIKAVLGNDGYYYHDLGKDENGNQIYGSKIYADFTGLTVMSHPIASVTVNGKTEKGIIDLGGFDFSKSEGDQEILTYLANRNNDVEATKSYLKELWGEQYETYAAQYKIDEVFAGKYHGAGSDCTEAMKKYLSKIIENGKDELIGCVAVDEELAEMLQMLADKYVNPMDYSVEFGWLKLCYYYEYLGA